jgi:hypothetical protein
MVYSILSDPLRPFVKKTYSNTRIRNKMTVNLLIVFFLFLYLVYIIIPMDEKDKEKWFTYFMTLFKEDLNNPISILYTVTLIVFIYLLIYFENIPIVDNKLPVLLNILIKKSWYFLYTLIVIHFFKIVLHIEVVDVVYNTFIMLSDNTITYSLDNSLDNETM